MGHTDLAWRAATPAVAAIILAAGCQADRREKPTGGTVGGTTAASSPSPRPRGANGGGTTSRAQADGRGAGTERLYYPTGSEGSSVLMMSVEAPRQAMVGRPFEYQVVVKNLTPSTLAGVTVLELPHQESMAGSFESEAGFIGSAVPAARGAEQAEAGGNWMERQVLAAWPVGTLGPRESRTLAIPGSAGDLGIAMRCFSVSYNPSICTVVSVVRPELSLTKTAPARALICDPLTYEYVVRNTGSGAAENVVITDELPEGLAAQDGTRAVRIDVGTLEAGEEESFRVPLTASRSGSYTSRAVAASGPFQAQSDEVATVIGQPALEVRLAGPETAYTGRPVAYQVIVTNNGDAPATDARLELNAPGLDNPTRDLGTIQPGESRRVDVTASVPAAQDAQELRLQAAATARCAERVVQAASTQIRALSALLLEVVDTDDPVPLGQDTTYAITVRNQGFGPARNVRVQAMLPAGLEFQDASGTTPVDAAGQTLEFGPVPLLAAGDQATWRVRVRAAQAGSVQFQLRMQSDEMDEPAVESEPTRLYE